MIEEVDIHVNCDFYSEIATLKLLMHTQQIAHLSLAKEFNDFKGTGQPF